MCDLLTRLDGLETVLQTNQSTTETLISRLSKLEISKVLVISLAILILQRNFIFFLFTN